MKKLIYFLLIALVLLSCLSACTVTQNVSGALAGEAESTAKVEEMLTALAENRASDAKNLIHPQVDEKLDFAIDQMITYLDGRKVKSMEQRSIKVNTSTDASGKSRQEQVSYQVTLNDGDVINLFVVYLSDNNEAGFTSFQMVLGVV